MTATVPTQRFVALLVTSALALAACTSAGPDTLARTEETPAFTLPPVTTSPLGTITPPPTTSPPSTTDPSNETIDGETTALSEEEAAPTGLAFIKTQLPALLGPTENLSETMNMVAQFPRAIPTPPAATITEISVGAGTANEDGTVIAQIAVSLRTTASSTVAFAQMSGAVQAAGMYSIDSTGQDDNRSESYRVPGGDQFDEVVITSMAEDEQTLLRIVSNAALPTGELGHFIDWADSRLPLPRGERERTLVVVSSSGEGRLATSTLTVESSVMVDGATAQREVNRLVDRVENSEAFETNADPDADQPLTGSLGFEGLDSLQYWVLPATRTVVNSEGELDETEAIEIGLTGTVSL